MKIYLSAAIMGARNPEASCVFYEAVSDALVKRLHCQVYLPHHFTSPTLKPNMEATEIFENDINKVYESDVVLALLDEPSLGVGSEIALALQKGIFVIGTHSNKNKASRFTSGMLVKYSNGKYFTYEDIDDLVYKVENELRVNQTLLSKTAMKSFLQESSCF
jgi:nucleoside 2-deoxyribosyltransferase